MAPIASAITRVLVTGFGPFSGVENNPSWGIASRLPSTLPNNIELIIHPQYVPVAYHPVIELVPELIKTHQPDISLHMGVAAGRTYFAVEQTSHKYGYQWSLDVDGEVFTKQESEVVWGGQPATLSTDLDLRAVVDSWQNYTSDIKWPINMNSGNFREQSGQSVEVKLLEDVMNTDDVQWSDDVGSYLCAFIYYTGLVEGKKNGKTGMRDVSFMHVPSLGTEEELQTGVDVAVGLIQALVDTWREKRGVA